MRGVMLVHIKKGHKAAILYQRGNNQELIGYYDEKIAKLITGHEVGMWKIKKLK